MSSVPLYCSAGAYGLLRVVLDPACNARVLLHGATRHGMQSLDPARSGEPLAYYHRTGPLGDVFSGWKPRDGQGRVGIIGLGAGCIAAYAEPGQRFTFFEIDPAVARLAGDPQHFTFLTTCRGSHEVVIGDGRESLEKAQDRSFDLLIVDAFQDAVIPAHLACPEALQVYLRRIAPDGLIVFHIATSGAMLPELRQWAGDAGLAYLFRADVNLTDVELAAGKLPSFYVVMARDTAHASWLLDHPRWTAQQNSPNSTQ